MVDVPNQLPQLLLATVFLLFELPHLRRLQPQPLLLRRVLQALQSQQRARLVHQLGPALGHHEDQPALVGPQ